MIQTTVFSVLDEAAGPLRVGEIHELVVRMLGRTVSYDTVNSCLSVAARDLGRPIVRCGVGLYVASRAAQG